MLLQDRIPYLGVAITKKRKDVKDVKDTKDKKDTNAGASRNPERHYSVYGVHTLVCVLTKEL